MAVRARRDASASAPAADGTGRSGASTATRHGSPASATGSSAAHPGGLPSVVAVYGDGGDSADSTVVLYRSRVPPGTAPAVGRRTAARGWTTDHHENDRRNPVGVFTLSDAGGVLPDPAPAPGSGLPYTRSASFAAPRWWDKSYWHDFDYVIAINYNRVKGTAERSDATRGGVKGGGIWLHMDHGSGTSACVSLPEPAMEYLLRTWTRTGTRWRSWGQGAP